MLIHSRYNSIYSLPDEKMLKVCPLSNQTLANHKFIQHYCSPDYFIVPEKIEVEEDRYNVYFEQGGLLGESHAININKFCVNILQALVHLESLNLTHGDIKLDNIVYHKGRYKFIDFELLPNIHDNSLLTQSHNDHFGYLIRAFHNCIEYNTLDQALYAFGIVFTSILKDQNSWIDKKIEGIIYPLVTGGIDFMVFASKCAVEIYKDEDKWIEENVPEEYREFVKRLVGKKKFKSFTEALKFVGGVFPSKIKIPEFPHREIKCNTQIVYNLLALEYTMSQLSANVIDSIYRFGYLYDDITELIFGYLKDDKYYHEKMHNVSNGCEITFLTEKDYSSKLLLEYFEQGSWCTNKEVTLEELLGKQNLPKRIIRRTFISERT